MKVTQLRSVESGFEPQYFCCRVHSLKTLSIYYHPFKAKECKVPSLKEQGGMRILSLEGDFQDTVAEGQADPYTLAHPIWWHFRGPQYLCPSKCFFHLQTDFLNVPGSGSSEPSQQCNVGK